MLTHKEGVVVGRQCVGRLVAQWWVATWLVEERETVCGIREGEIESVRVCVRERKGESDDERRKGGRERVSG